MFAHEKKQQKYDVLRTKVEIFIKLANFCNNCEQHNIMVKSSVYIGFKVLYQFIIFPISVSFKNLETYSW